MNRENKRKLPEDASVDFIPKKILPLVKVEGKMDKSAWECALLTAIRDEIKSGNFSVTNSKRFGRFDNFFVLEEKWNGMRESFFRRAGLPSDPKEAGQYLTERLNAAFDLFLERLPEIPLPASKRADGTFHPILEKSWTKRQKKDLNV